jgi:hypothetical protein
MQMVSESKIWIAVINIPCFDLHYFMELLSVMTGVLSVTTVDRTTLDVTVLGMKVIRSVVHVPLKPLVRFVALITAREISLSSASNVKGKRLKSLLSNLQKSNSVRLIL